MIANMEWFRTFKAIYETGSLTGAAQALYISQPGVSLHLNSLEAFTGYKLFDRAARKMVPTERGKVLYNFILEPVSRLEMAEQHFNRSSVSEKATISVGMCFETFQYTLEPHISRFPFNLIIKFGEYPQMQHDLDKGVLDLIITPQKGNQQGLQYVPFSKERIVMVGGSRSDTKAFKKLITQKKLKEAEAWLQKQTWYSTAADMDNLKKFWHLNFNKHPDFKPNYIVPNICSIIRCISDGEGFAIIPDFLCQEEVEQGKVKLVWEGNNVIENTLYFGTRKKTIYTEEIRQIQEIFEQRH
ncbi:LysR family transcriptional regulator [Chitinophaga tropicalis]|uniref:LysR family transcriptional regulator n=1 Tax=Chitinophaga tropicalis TaxID=2683588 RepID=A0A7K1UCA3_9BACT|nr:LysR family transcriptional regulator [Chitinophaga tropicalis]MVT12019.1 LysR family transcriptional regulator [Chitinophaga tropicalis]